MADFGWSEIECQLIMVATSRSANDADESLDQLLTGLLTKWMSLGYSYTVLVVVDRLASLTLAFVEDAWASGST
jgi:hypothetical protein